MNEVKNQLTINSTLQQFLDFLENDFKLQNCLLPKHRYPCTNICLDKRCITGKQLFEPLCAQCQIQNPHTNAKDNHKTKLLLETLQELIRLSFSNLNNQSNSDPNQLGFTNIRQSLKDFLCEIRKIQTAINQIVDKVKQEYDNAEKLNQEKNIDQPQNQLKQQIILILTQENPKYLNEHLKSLNNIIKLNDKNEFILNTNEADKIKKFEQFKSQLSDSLQKSIKEQQDFIKMIGQQNVQSNSDGLFAKSLIFLANDDQIKSHDRLFLKCILEDFEKKPEFMSFLKFIDQKGLNDIISQQQAVLSLKTYVEEPNAHQSSFQSLALVVIGFCYEFGYGVDKNDTARFSYYQKSADLGNSYGQYKLSICYSDGKGTEKDLDKLFKLAKLSSEQNNGYGLNAFGYCYYNGVGIEKNAQLAFKYYKLSADQGNSYGQYGLGICYKNGEGTEKNLQLAFKYYKLSADQGNSYAQYNLGVCYKNGEGIEKNLEMALKYYKLSADQGDQDALQIVKNW